MKKKANNDQPYSDRITESTTEQLLKEQEELNNEIPALQDLLTKIENELYLRSHPELKRK